MLQRKDPRIAISHHAASLVRHTLDKRIFPNGNQYLIVKALIAALASEGLLHAKKISIIVARPQARCKIAIAMTAVHCHMIRPALSQKSLEKFTLIVHRITNTV